VSSQAVDRHDVAPADHVRWIEGRLADDLDRVWMLWVGGSREERARFRLAGMLLGAEAVTVESAWEAGRLLTAGPFDVVLVDVDEPDVDGEVMLKAARRVPVIAVSADRARPAALRGSGPFAGFLIKPVYPEQVLVAIRPMVRRRATPARRPFDEGISR